MATEVLDVPQSPIAAGVGASAQFEIENTGSVVVYRAWGAIPADDRAWKTLKPADVLTRVLNEEVYLKAAGPNAFVSLSREATP